MLSRRKISEILDWISAIFYHPFITVVINLIVGIALTIVAEKFIESESVRNAFNITIYVIVALATWQTLWLRYEFKQYFKREYIQEIVNSGGKTTRELQAYIVDQYDGKGITTLSPGKDYTLEFSLKGGVLAKNPFSRKLTPVLRMFPSLFLGSPNLQKTEKEISRWVGTAELVDSLDNSNSWGVRGNIAFDTSRINPSTELTEEVQLVLEFREDDAVVFTFDLGSFAVHLLKEQELLSRLIKFEALKKLPPGYDVLNITYNFSTNMVFLPRVLIDLKKRADKEDDIDAIEIAIANIFKDKFRELQDKNFPKKLGLLVYDPEPDEQDLNVSEFLNSILPATKPTASKLEQQVYVSLFQTAEFLSRLDKQHALGICLFGFRQCIHGLNITVIFDLSHLTLAPSLSIDDCVIDKSHLDDLADCSPEYFQKYAPMLAKGLVQSKTDIGSSGYQAADLSSDLPPSLDPLLDKLQNSFDNSQKFGRFVVSEPEITSVWVNLAIFSRELNESHRQKELIQAIFYIINRAKKGYRIDPSNLSIVNLCSEHSGIANELSILWDLDKISKTTYNIPCCNVVISKRGEVTLEPKDQVADSGQSRDVILLIPIDSYVKAIKRVLEYVRGKRNNVISIISLFSIARNWDFVTASEYFDVHPLFQVDPDPKDPLLPHSRRITQRDDVRRLRPWLGQ